MLHMTGYEAPEVRTRYQSAHPSQLVAICSRCEEQDCDASTCTRACARCLHPTGHTKECIRSESTLPPKLKVCDVNTVPIQPCAESNMKAAQVMNAAKQVVEAFSPNFQNRTIAATACEVAETVASLDIVHDSVEQFMAQNPHDSMPDALRKCIFALAATIPTVRSDSHGNVQICSLPNTTAGTNFP